MKITQISTDNLDEEIKKARDESLQAFGESGSSQVNMGVVDAKQLSQLLVDNQGQSIEPIIQAIPVSVPNENSKKLENTTTNNNVITKTSSAPKISKSNFMNKIRNKNKKPVKNKEKKLGL